MGPGLGPLQRGVAVSGHMGICWSGIVVSPIILVCTLNSVTLLYFFLIQKQSAFKLGISSWGTEAGGILLQGQG